MGKDCNIGVYVLASYVTIPFLFTLIKQISMNVSVELICVNFKKLVKTMMAPITVHVMVLTSLLQMDDVV